MQNLQSLVGIDQDQDALDLARPRLEAALRGGASLYLDRCNFRHASSLQPPLESGCRGCSCLRPQ